MNKIVVIFLYAVLSSTLSYASIEDLFFKRIENVRSLEVCFIQKSKVDQIQENYDVYEGKLIFKKPLKFRWYYTKNSKAVVVSDGKFIYAYFPEQNQLNISQIDNSTEIFPLISLVSSRKDFEKFYDKEAVNVSGSFTEIVFKPKFKGSMFKEISIVFSNKRVIPVRILTLGVDGSENIYDIACWKENVKVNDSMFTIKPKEGTSINRY